MPEHSADAQQAATPIEGAPIAEAAPTTIEPTTMISMPVSEAPVVVQREGSAPIVETPVSVAAVAPEPSAQPIAPVPVAPVPVAPVPVAPVPVATASVGAQPVVSPSPSAPAIQVSEESLRQSLDAVGLQWVQTDPSKSSLEAMPEPPQKLGRAPRRNTDTAPQEPLVMVETRQNNP